jgi:hypothetical protein
MVAGMLDGHHGAPFLLQLRDDVETMLQSRADDDLLRVADHSAGTLQVSLNIATQSPFALGLAIL